MRRFYVFATTVARYRNKRWLHDEYFERSILKQHPQFDRERIQSLYWKLKEFVEFYQVSPMPTYEYNSYRTERVVERGVRNGDMYEKVVEALFKLDQRPLRYQAAQLAVIELAAVEELSLPRFCGSSLILVNQAGAGDVADGMLETRSCHPL